MFDNELDVDMDQVVSFLKEYGGHHLSHLILLQDKQVFWAQENKVLIAYRRTGNKLMVLGDPIGEESRLKDAIDEFCNYGEELGLTPIFYQVSSHYMHHYHEHGYRFTKVGEEAIVNLQDLTFAGKQWAKLRTRCNKFNRNGFTFTVLQPPYSTRLLGEVAEVSKSWLGSQKEKGFSVVSFSEDYVSSFPIALLKDSESRIIAFATIAISSSKSTCIDLMRKTATSPHGTMDVLFINIFKWLKEQQYETCSLGMAPLSNVGNHKDSQMCERIMRQAYHHGNHLYNFKGLREFKGKFTDSFEPKYIGHKKSFVPLLLIQLVTLINRPPVKRTRAFARIKDLLQNTG
ncbi:phosphatidylglycerol lysyltransferase domain-containing protein [Guptibacillus algicola]|uniref:phosphatidylglycerol lysyltransferase domain-containing protein n=1 Tax=Guptibacillus algicola TaxID=225844 RepID=UPI001CD4FE76|nr:phosphatidylglycerol lysyltransferase domain-containing protein [Alkalihalobacillus algicola]MCA0988595.1 phosphatidylglycerol lysyltransferase domain-containing protein [Alkalihalobacillus algicola]